MGYKSLRHCLEDLEQQGDLIRIKSEVDPNLEMAEIHRRIFEAKGPAILFEKVKGSPFQAASNVYGTFERTEYIFSKELKKMKKILELKADFSNLLKNPLGYVGAPFTAIKALPQKSIFSSPIFYGETTIGQLPQIVSWPMDGGAFITLPQVYSEDPDKKGIMSSNIGMYRIQMSGNNYIQDKEVGLHYQIHRGIGIHHQKYNNSNKPFKVSIFVGGPPSHAFSAIMPMPEGISELTFAGMLNDRRFRYSRVDDYVISSEADFVITGTIKKGVKKPEGPFGDHFGYYSLEHDFPVMEVENVYHRKDAIWHFTVVSRPPAEDSSFGHLIHLLVKELTPAEFPGVHEVNAVDAAGVHPLLLAIGSERYMPFRDKKPEEILTIANRILGSGQTSLAKFLFIIGKDSDKNLNTKDIRYFFNYLLKRTDWTKDLHFHTNTTIDTLDYSGDGWNSGSKLVVACYRDPFKTLSSDFPEGFQFNNADLRPVFFDPGILILQMPTFTSYKEEEQRLFELCEMLEQYDMSTIPLIILADDSEFTAKNVNNFVWVTFTRANPSHDIYGVNSFSEYKHWGCHGSLIIDARVKTHHAPALVPDKKVKEKVDKLFAPGGELYKMG